MFLANDEHFTLNIISGLEKYSIQRAMDANRYRVDNKAVPKYKISEYDFPLIEEIYEEIEFIMATLGYRMNGIDAQNVFTTSRRGVVAYGIYTGENFEVQPNSEIDFSHLAKLESYNAQRKALLDDGTIIKQSDGKYYLKKIIGFKTPSGAADFVLGGSNNGWVEWKDKDGKTLDELIRQSI